MTEITTPNSNHPIILSKHEANMLQQDNISIAITVRNGIQTQTVEGYNKNGGKVVINGLCSDGNSLIQQSISVCDKLSPSERKKIVKYLKKNGNNTQAEIAKRLGVSQTTVSTDLKK